jgi:hypothetical protein
MANYTALPCGMGFRAIGEKKFLTAQGKIRQTKAMIAGSLGMTMMGVGVVVVMIMVIVGVVVLVIMEVSLLWW